MSSQNNHDPYDNHGQPRDNSVSGINASDNNAGAAAGQRPAETLNPNSGYRRCNTRELTQEIIDKLFY